MALDYGENNAGILITYAGILIEDEQYEKAEIVLRKASVVSSVPDQTEKILRNILILQFQNGAYNDAKMTIEEIRRKFPNSERVDTLEYMLYLIKKEFFKGWILHEKRDVRRPSWCLGKPEYNLESTGTVFVSSEQGIGDELMFSTVLPDLISHSNKVIVECDKRLYNLYSRSFGPNIRFICNGDKLEDNEFDYQIRLGSLPKFFRKTEKSFERCSKGILKCDDILATKLREQIKMQFDKPIVGLSWKSELNRRLNRGNSMRLKELLESLQGINAVFVNLQYGDVQNEIKEASEGLGVDILYDDSIDYKNDIDTLASLIKACDYVITTPNVTVSLSGNLGVKTYYLMPKAGDRWKWGMNEKKCYWFNSVEIFRQKKQNDWNSAILALLEQLKVM